MTADAPEPSRDLLLGEIDVELILARRRPEVGPGEQIALEREPAHTRDPYRIRAENGRCELVGYLPRPFCAWLGPLIDREKIRIEGYIPWKAGRCSAPASHRCPLVLAIFLRAPGQHLVEPTRIHSKQSGLHELVRRAYEAVQSLTDPDLVLEMADGLVPLARQELLPETRLLLALLPNLAREMRIAQALHKAASVCLQLRTLLIGAAQHRDHLTVFPLSWPQVQQPHYVFLRRAIDQGLAVVEATSREGPVPHLQVSNRGDSPVMVPEGETLIVAGQSRVVERTVLLAPRSQGTVSIRSAEHGCPRRRSKDMVSPSQLVSPSQPASPARALRASEQDRLLCGQHFAALEDASGILVAKGEGVVGVDLFDSPATLRALWEPLWGDCFLDALHNPEPSPQTPDPVAGRFLQRIADCVRPRAAAFGKAHDLEIVGDGLRGTVAFHAERICHLSALGVAVSSSLPGTAGTGGV